MNVHHSAEWYAGQISEAIGVFPDRAGRDRLIDIIKRISHAGADQALDGPWSAILDAAIPDGERARLIAAVTQASQTFGNARLTSPVRTVGKTSDG